MLAQTIIEDAASEIGVTRLGFSLGGEEAQLMFRIMNRMLSTFSAEQVMIPYRTRESIALSAGAYAYTIGTSGTLNTVRPISIDVAKLKSGTTEYDLEPVSLDRFSVEQDLSSSGRPDRIYYEPTFPLGTIYFNRTVDQAYTLILNSYKPMSQFTSLVLDTDFAPEYEEMLVTNLAVRAAPHFRKSASQDTKAMAMKTYSVVKNNNLASRVPTLGVDPALVGGKCFDIFAGDP